MVQILKDSLLFFRLNFRAIAAVLLPILVVQFSLVFLLQQYVVSDDSAAPIKNLSFLVNQLSYLVYTSALIFLFDGILTGKNVDPKTCTIKAIRAIPIVLLAYIPVMLVISAGYILIMPGIFLTARLSLFLFYLLLYSMKPYDAVMSSFKGTSGYTVQILVLMVLGGLPVMSVWFVLFFIVINQEISFFPVFQILELIFTVGSTLMLIVLFRVFCLLDQNRKNPAYKL